MGTSSDMWLAFIKTAGMLFIVIAALVLLLYVIRRFSSAGGVKTGKTVIKVIGMHHFSPKEKVVLLDVLDEKILIGVTPQTITSLGTVKKELGTVLEDSAPSSGFSAVFSEKLKRSFSPNHHETPQPGKKEKDNDK